MRSAVDLRGVKVLHPLAGTLGFLVDHPGSRNRPLLQHPECGNQHVDRGIMKNRVKL
jgi:hypothetical protein